MIQADLLLNEVQIYKSDASDLSEFTAERFKERINYGLKRDQVKEIFIEKIATTSLVWNTMI